MGRSDLRTGWVLAASVRRVWGALADPVASLRRWEDVDVEPPWPKPPLKEGDVLHWRVRGAWGLRLRFATRVTGLEVHRHVRASLSGDLEGEAACLLEPGVDPEGAAVTTLRFQWQLRSASRRLALLSGLPGGPALLRRVRRRLMEGAHRELRRQARRTGRDPAASLKP